MDRVYVVTEGCYSDYKIVAVFANRALAEDFAGGPEDVEEYRLWDGPIPSVPVLDLSAIIDQKGHIAENEHVSPYREDLADEWKAKPGRCEVSEPHAWNEYSFQFSVTGTDIERVRKVYSERKAEYLATYATILYGFAEARKARRGEVEQWRAAPWPAEAKGIVPPSYQELFDAEWDRLFPDGAPDPDEATSE